MEIHQPGILIVDDHDIVLRGLMQITYEALGPTAHVDTARNGNTAMEMASRQHYDLCLLDIELPDTDGIRLLRTLKSAHPHMRIIVNTIHEQLWYVKEYMSANVDGILFKDVNAAEISQAIRTVLAGERYFCPRARALKFSADTYETPTMRELEVLRLIAQGGTTEQIASKLHVTVNTIESHRRHLLEKLNARNVAELILNAVSQGLIDTNRD